MLTKEVVTDQQCTYLDSIDKLPAAEQPQGGVGDTGQDLVVRIKLVWNIST